jgi:pimeloyl-ACP methyl ester carboxylesterase
LKPSLNFGTLCGTLLLAAILPAAQAQHASTGVQTHGCHLPGVEDALRCLKLPVALDPTRPGAARLGEVQPGQTIQLHVTIAPALREGARPDPLFLLAGGPGEAGSEVLPVLNTAMRRVRPTRDIVFIDQRGTGLSGKLECKPGLDEDSSLSDDQVDAALVRCIQASKAPFAAYTTANAARDIEQVRRALGYGKINLWGGSYGTRLGQAYARAYPANVRTLILDAVAAPDQVIPAGGRDSQAALDKLFGQCDADPACRKAYPGLRAEFDGLVAKVGKGLALSLPDPRTARQVDVKMTSARLLGTVHGMLYSPADARRLPFLVHSAAQGRWQPFVARRNLGADSTPEGSSATLLYLAVICAEDMPRFTPALIASDDAPLTRDFARRLPGLCRAMNVPAVTLPAPTTIECAGTAAVRRTRSGHGAASRRQRGTEHDACPAPERTQRRPRRVATGLRAAPAARLPRPSGEEGRRQLPERDSRPHFPAWQRRPPTLNRDPEHDRST